MVSRRRLIAGSGGFVLGLIAGGSLIGRVATTVDVEHLRCRPLPLHRNKEGDISIAYRRKGSGPPLVVLHGAGSDGRAWDFVAGRLAQNYDVLIPDIPGFGQSPMRSGLAPNVANLTDAVATWLQALGVKQPHVVGNSLGGALALEFGFRGLARSVTALSPIGFWNYMENLYAR